MRVRSSPPDDGQHAAHHNKKENAMWDSSTTALLGRDPAAFTEDVPLATPITLPRITSRDTIVAALSAYAAVTGATPTFAQRRRAVRAVHGQC